MGVEHWCWTLSLPSWLQNKIQEATIILDLSISSVLFGGWYNKFVIKWVSLALISSILKVVRKFLPRPDLKDFWVQWGSTRKGKGGPVGKGPQNAALRSIGGKHTQAPAHGLSWLSYYRLNSCRWLQRSHIGHCISNKKSFNAYVIGW